MHWLVKSGRPRALWVSAGCLLVACMGTPPNRPSEPAGSAAPGVGLFHLQAVTEQPVVAVATDSQISGFTATRLIDHDPGTQWINGAYRSATGWARVTLAGRVKIDRIALKTGPSAAGTSYDIQVSDDGVTWVTRLANQTNTTWNMETKILPAGTAGLHVRVLFHNRSTAPIDHFTLFELLVMGDAGDLAPVPGPTPTSGTGNSRFYPDLQARPATSFWIERTVGARKLHFATAMANGGAGEFQLKGSLSGTQTHATQEIIDDTGRVYETRSVGDFAWHPAHNHFHIDQVSRYELRRDGPAGLVLTRADKVSFCMLDSTRLFTWGPQSRYATCTATLQGITRGWADLYTSTTPGQDLTVTTVAPGEYYLVTWVDPTNKFIDADRTNNAAWVKLFLDPPRGVVQVRSRSQ